MAIDRLANGGPMDDDFKKDMRERMSRLEDKVDKLLEFKWRIIGGAGAIGGLFSVALALFVEWIKR